MLQTLVVLVSSPAGAVAFAQLPDVSPLMELAPHNPDALDVLSFAWLGAAATASSPRIKQTLAKNVDDGLLRLALAFKGTDGVTLLAFVGRLLRDLDLEAR